MTTSDDLVLRPAVSFAFLQILPMMLLSVSFLVLAWYLSPYFIFFSIAVCAAAGYRIIYIRSIRYLISQEYIVLTKGILFKREDRLEMYRIKDYIITRPLSLQLFGLMNLTLISTETENAVIILMGIPLSTLTDTIRERVQMARHANQILEIN